jgi:putative ABC transport system substrate-binding protein
MSVVGLGFFLWFGHEDCSEKRAKFKIGIIQSASHPALDQARNGFIEVTKKAFDGDVEYVVRNAQGSVANNHAIAASFHAHDDIDLIFAIATPAAQAIAALEKNKPICIAAVTDVERLREHGNRNICGGSDKVNIPGVIALIKQLLPNAKTIALLAQTGDINAQEEIVEMERELACGNLISVRIGFASEADVPAVVLSACGKGDAILTPNYNIISSSMSLVSSIAQQNNKPLITCDPNLIQLGALAAHGVDYYVNGQQAGECAVHVLLHHKNPHDLPIKRQEGITVINKNAADKLRLTIPHSLESAMRKDTP